MAAKIEQWYTAWATDNPYAPPEARGKSIIGLVYGSSKFKDGEQIKTGAIKEATGRVITTTSDEVYELGEPEPGYVEWMKKEGVEFDEAEPVKLVTTFKHGGLTGKRPPGGGRRS